MKISNTFWQGLSWVFLVSLAFFSAEALAGGVSCWLRVEARPIQETYFSSIQHQFQAPKASAELVGLMGTTVPDQTAPTPHLDLEGPSPDTRPIQKQSRLTLRGILAGTDGNGLALIDYQGKTRVLSVGQELARMILIEVKTHEIRLLGPGGERVLRLGSEKKRVEPSVESARTSADSLPAANRVKKLPSAGAIMTRRELIQLLDNIEKFAGTFKIEMVHRRGETVGTKVTILDQNHPLARLGIRDGDIIKSLNRNPLNSPDSLTTAFRVLRNSLKLNFEVERGGQTRKVSITLEE